MREPDNRLAARLRAMRQGAGLSAAQVAERTSLSQPRISRIETGKFNPSPNEVAELCRACGASADEQRELTQLARDVRERSEVNVVLEGAGPWSEARLGRLERRARLVRAFSATGVPGLLQTREYATALLSGDLAPADVERTLEARAARQEFVYDDDRRLEVVLTEGALRWQVGGGQVMADQLDRLVELSRGPSIQLGVIPWTRPVAQPVFHHAFTIYDADAVLVGAEGASALLSAAREVAEHEAHWTDLSSYAVRGDGARSVLRRLATDFRALT